VEFIISSSRALFRGTVCLSLINLLELTVYEWEERCLLYVFSTGVKINFSTRITKTVSIILTGKKKINV